VACRTRSNAEGIWTTIWFEEAHHSTAIEGNTLVLKQVEPRLAYGVAVGDTGLREYMEVRGYANATRAWVDAHNAVAFAERPIEALALAHNLFERVHPLSMGTGAPGDCY
jgi:hypothetical protein